MVDVIASQEESERVHSVNSVDNALDHGQSHGTHVPPVLQAGRTCFLNMIGQYFLAEILHVQGSTVIVSFPGKDYPVEGLNASLEFHDREGFDSYPMEVVKGPDSLESGISLRMLGAMRRSVHREACRVPLELPVKVSEQSVEYECDAVLVNLSASGALMQTDTPFDLNAGIKVLMQLPGEGTQTLGGQVVHIANAPPWRKYPPYVVGVRFTGVGPETEGILARFIWIRLQELFPRE
jgi:hypothetical protein